MLPAVKPRRGNFKARRTQVKPPVSVRQGIASQERAKVANVDPVKSPATVAAPLKAPPAMAAPAQSPAVQASTPVKTVTNKDSPILQTKPLLQKPSVKPALSGKTVVKQNRPAKQSTNGSHDNSQIADLQREVEFLSFSRELTSEFVQSTGGVKEVMKLIFTRVLQVLDAEAGSLWLLDEKSGTNICHLAEGPATDRILGLRLPLKTGIVGGVIANNQSDVVLNCASDSRFDAGIDKKSSFKTESMICVPLADQGNAFGAIQIINKRSGFQKRFAEEDRRLVEDMALAASIAGRNARLLESESRVKEMSTLMEISQQITASVDLDQVLDLVANLSGDLAETAFTAVGLVEEDKDRLFIAAMAPETTIDPNSPWQKKLLELMEQVRKSGKNGYVSDRQKLKAKEPDSPWVAYLEERGTESAWATSLSDEEGVLGVLWMESEESRFMSGNSSDMVGILATQATVALRNASLFQRIPFADVLGRMGKKGKKWASGWRRLSLAVGLLLLLAYWLHVLPVFRTVTGDCLVESRFGQGIYLRTAGRIQESLVKEGQKVKAGELLARLDDLPFRLKLVESESKLALLERQIIESKAVSDSGAMSRAIIEKIAAQAELRQARREIEQVAIRSPIDGVVLTPRPAELIGRDFPLGAEILRVANPEQFTVVAQIPEEDVLDVQIGQKVSGVLRSRPGQGFRGEVIHVGRAYSIPAEALEKGVADTATPEGFVAEIKVVERDVELLPGMTGRAAISTPEVSVMTRFWRRIVNIGSFWFGLTLSDVGQADTAKLFSSNSRG